MGNTIFTIDLGPIEPDEIIDVIDDESVLRR